MKTSLVVLAILLACGWWRLHSPDLRRPFVVDELLTIQYYTWAGLGPSGEPRRLPHATDLAALPAPTPLQLAAGLYCAFGRWPEPNNQIPNSLLVAAALALGGRDEASIRLPAWLGGLAFAAALAYLCGPVLGWRAAAPLVALWAWFHPFVVSFSQMARGYTWMLAFQALLIVLAYRLARTRRPLLLGALGAGLAVFSILNVVSMAVDWILPFYLALLLARPGGPALEPADRAPWRRAVAAQALAVLGMGAIFLLCNLAAVYSSMRQYGLPFDSPGSLLEAAGLFLDELFPGVPDRAFALLGAGGLAALCLDRSKDRFLRLLVALTVGVSLLHYLAGGRFPYGRAAGHVIPLLLLGVAYLAEAVIRLYDNRAGRVAMFAMLAAATALLALATPRGSMAIPGLTERLALIRDAEVPADSTVLVTVREGVDYLAAFYAPDSWDLVDAVEPGRDLTVLSFEAVPDPLGARPGFPVIDLVRVDGRTRPLDDEAVPPGAWIFWYPDFPRLGVDAAEQHAFVRGHPGCVALPRHRRHLVKLDVYSGLDCFILMPGPGPGASSCAEVAREGLRRFGGRAVVFSPGAGGPDEPTPAPTPPG